MAIGDVFARVEEAGVLAVLIIERAEDAAPLAEALLAGGVRAMELTLRSDAALPAIAQVARTAPEMLVGAGTVLRPDQVAAVYEAGAAFAVSPGVNPKIVSAAADVGLPFAPGIATPTDIEIAVEMGCRMLKFFPAELLGGLPYLRSVAAPYNHLGVKYVPLGGVKQDNLADYLDEPLIAAVGGSWLAPQELLAAQDWAAITARAQAASDVVKSCQKSA